MVKKFKELTIDWKRKKTITTSIPIDVYNYIKENSKRINNLIMLGLMAEEDNPQLLNRISEQERKSKMLEEKIGRIFELIGEINSKI